MRKEEISQSEETKTVIVTACHRGNKFTAFATSRFPLIVGDNGPCAGVFASSTTRLGGFNARLILYLTRFECSVKMTTYRCDRGVQRTDDRWVVSDASWRYSGLT